METDMEAMSSSDTHFRIHSGTFPILQNLLRKSSRGREINEFFLLRQIHPNVFKILVEYDSNCEYRSCLRGEYTILNEIWRSDRKKELLPDHFTAILQLALGLEHLHSQKLIHGDIKPENVLIWKSDAGITMKWAYFESPLQYDKSKKVDIQEQTNPRKITGQLSSFLGGIFSTQSHTQLTTDSQSHTVTQKLQEKGEYKINIEKGTEQMSDFEKEFHVNETIFFTDKRSRTWQAPELQTLSNPRTLATFESDVFAAGLVFGSLLLNGVHPFGVGEDEIISNIKMNKPVNDKKMESKRVTELILQMLTHKVEERIITSSDVVERMKLIQSEISEIPALIDELGKKTIIPWYCHFNHQRKNVIQELQLLIASGGDVNSVDKNGNNALQIMSKYYKQEKLFDIIRLLIENGFNVNFKDKNGDNVFTYLCKYYENENLIEIIQILIGNGFNVNSKDKNGDNVFTYLCKYYKNKNLIDISRLLVENGIDINYQVENGDNALIILCENYKYDNLVDIIQLLIENRIKVNCKNNYGENALTLLCQYYEYENLIDIIQLLIKHEIDVNCKTNTGWNALLLLCRNYQIENLIDIIRILIKNKIEVNCKVDDGWNALTTLYVLYKHENLLDITGLLIENGIDINCKNKSGDNALTVLCRYYKKENVGDIIRLLTENGIDIHLKVNHLEDVCLYVLATFKDKTQLDEVLKLLIRHGIQFSSKYCKKLQEYGMKNQIGGLEILKYMAEEELSLGWHPNCSSCNHIILIEESARRQVQHHQMFGNAFVAYHMILKDLQEWQKSTQQSVADQDEPNPGKLCEEAQNHFTASEDQECFKTMVEISEQMKGGDSSLFQCDLYEHYMRSLHSIARIIGAEKSKKQIEFFYLLPFDYSLTFPADKQDDPDFKTALSEWDKTLFCWMHTPGDDYYGKTLKKDSTKGLFSSVNDSLNCHGQQRKKQ